MSFSKYLGAAFGSFAILSGSVALAQESSFEGETIELIVPASAGGTYGMYAQLLADRMGDFVPGNPTVIANFMRGAGGMKASNYVGNVAATDGTVLYMMHQNAPTSQLLSPDAARYDAGEFGPIGVLSSMNSVMVVRTDLGIDEVTDVAETSVVAGSTGRGSYQFIVPTLLNEFSGTDFNIVTTYGGTGETMLALERGEIGSFMTSIISLESNRPDWFAGTGDAKVIMQVGMKPSSSFPDLPMLNAYANNEQQEKVYTFLSASNGFARALVAPAGTPEAQVETLQAAFLEMVQDEGFQQEAAERGLPLDWASAEELEEAIDAILATDGDILTFVQDIMDG